MFQCPASRIFGGLVEPSWLRRASIIYWSRRITFRHSIKILLAGDRASALFLWRLYLRSGANAYPSGLDKNQAGARI